MTEEQATNEAQAKLKELLGQRTLTDVFMCPGDDEHDAHIDLDFDGLVLQLTHTPEAMMMIIRHPADVSTDEAVTAEPHDRHAPCGSVQ